MGTERCQVRVPARAKSQAMENLTSLLGEHTYLRGKLSKALKTIIAAIKTISTLMWSEVTV